MLRVEGVEGRKRTGSKAEQESELSELQGLLSFEAEERAD